MRMQAELIIKCLHSLKCIITNNLSPQRLIANSNKRYNIFASFTSQTCSQYAYCKKKDLSIFVID